MNTPSTQLPTTGQVDFTPPPMPGSKHMRHDPILAELWAVKAQLNAQANYDVKRLLADAAATAARMTDANGQLRLDA
jgi:hypothetical protein